MPEAGGPNIELARHLTEHKEPSRSFRHEITEIAEAVVLASVAIATAWSGYQAALWTGHQSELYGRSTKLRVQAEAAAVYANQERLYNAATVVEWLKAEAREKESWLQSLSDVSFQNFFRHLRLGRKPTHSTMPALPLVQCSCPNITVPRLKKLPS